MTAKRKLQKMTHDKLAKMTHDDLVKKMLSNPAVKKEYDRLEDEFAILDEILSARKTAGMTQSSIARLETGLMVGNLPSLTMLKKYADAVGKKLQIRLV